MSTSSPKIAVILSGCGVYDGSEAFETVLSLLYIEEQGASYQAFAPNIEQHHVIDHTTGETSEETRNVLTESARLVRGEVKDLQNLNAEDFDALIVPGGFGVAKNLCDFAFTGDNMQVEPLYLEKAKSFAEAGKPMGLMCITPVTATKIFDKPSITIGNDEDTIKAVESMGATHISCEVNEAYIDEANKLVTTPAYMLASSVLEASTGIELLVKSVIDMIE